MQKTPLARVPPLDPHASPSFSPLSRVDSQRFTLLRLPLIVAVLLIHSSETSVSVGGTNLVDGGRRLDGFARFIINLVSQELARVAVPVFFAVAGFFFFRTFTGEAGWYRTRILARAKSLAIPYLIWTTAWVLLFFIAQSIPAVRSLFSGGRTPVAQMTALQLADAWIGMSGEPAAYHLWFIRDLFLLSLLSPLVLAGVTNLGAPFLLALGVWWLSGRLFPLAHFAEGTLWFTVGAYCALKNVSPFCGDRYAIAFVPLYALFAACGAASHGTAVGFAFTKAAVLSGVPSVLMLTELVRQRECLREPLLRLSRYSFFVYAAHEPLLMLVRKMLYRAFDVRSSLGVLACYFTAPILTLVLLLFVFRFLERHAPMPLSIACGGRG